MNKSEKIKEISNEFKIYKSENSEYYILLDSQNNIQFLESYIKNNILKDEISIINKETDSINLVNYTGIGPIDSKSHEYQCYFEQSLFTTTNRVIFDSFEDFINKFKVKSPKVDFYLIEEKEAYFEGNSSLSPYLENYQKILKIFNILDTYADHKDDKTTYLQYIFLGNSKIEINSKISKECFKKDLKEIDLFTDILENRSKNDTAIVSSLFKTTLYNFLIKIDIEDRFLVFLTNFNLITKEIESTYLIYLQEYNLDKIREELQEKNSDYYKRLNDSLSDTLLKSISLPLSFFLIIGKINSSSLLLNLGIILGLIIIQYIILNLIKNQEITIQVIEEEFTQLENKIGTPTDQDYSRSDIVNKINTMIDKLKKRADNISTVLTIIKRTTLFFSTTVILIIIFIHKANIKIFIEDIKILYAILVT